MAKSRKVDVVDSYAAIKAVKHAVEERGQPPSSPAGADSPRAAPEPAEPRPAVAAGARTVVPTKRTIECYECSYRFPLSGRAANTHCPKCRVKLDLTNHIIDRRWTGELKTCGVVWVYPNGVLGNGILVANDIVLEGVIESANARAMRRLELRRGGKFNQETTRYIDLVLGEGTTLELTGPTQLHDVEVAGQLVGQLQVSGLLSIKPGGVVQGEVRGQHLAVEEGGGLLADVSISAEP